MMSLSEREEWLVQRGTGIGGSEIGALLSHLISDVKYGCRRQLWYRKSKIAPDYEEEETAPMLLGTLMEGPACDLYAELTGRRVEEVGRMVHPDHPELGVSLDRLVHAPEKPKGIAETKNMGSRGFYEVKRKGVLPFEYLLQANHGMLIAGAALQSDINWAVMIVGRSDDPKMIARTLAWHLKLPIKPEINPAYLLYWETEKSKDICDAILREGPVFWQSIGNPDLIPERLPEPDDPRCGRCAWRLQCRGPLAVSSSEDGMPTAPELAPFAAEYIERKKMSDEAAELVAETKEIIMLMLGDKQAVQVPVGDKLRPVYFRPQAGKPLYAAAVKDMGAQYNVLRDKLIKISNNPEMATQLSAGAELVPPPSSFIKTGKSSRPLLLQFLDPKAKEEE